MTHCDVCGKSSLLSEKLGNAHICKVCFMKVNGPFWKYRTYEKFDDATKQRTKALEKAKPQNFPESVLEGINTFFDGQIRGMMKCDGCGLTVQTCILLVQVNCAKSVSLKSTKMVGIRKNAILRTTQKLRKCETKPCKLLASNNSPR